MSGEKVIALDWGWGRKPFSEQFANTDIAILLTPEDFAHIEKDAEAILRLHLRGIISDAEQSRAVTRAQKRIASTARSHADELRRATTP